jgi:hypothetical protein
VIVVFTIKLNGLESRAASETASTGPATMRPHGLHVADELIVDIRRQQKQGLQVAQQAIRDADEREWKRVRSFRQQYSMILVVLDCLVIFLRFSVNGFTTWTPQIRMMVSGIEMTLFLAIYAAAMWVSLATSG